MFAMNRIHALVATSFLLVMAHAKLGRSGAAEPDPKGQRAGRMALGVLTGHLLLREIPLPSGEGGATAPGEGSPLHDSANRRNRGTGCPHPALRASFSRREKDASHTICNFGCRD